MDGTHALNRSVGENKSLLRWSHRLGRWTATTVQKTKQTQTQIITFLILDQFVFLYWTLEYETFFWCKFYYRFIWFLLVHRNWVLLLFRQRPGHAQDQGGAWYPSLRSVHAQDQGGAGYPSLTIRDCFHSNNCAKLWDDFCNKNCK